MLQKFHGLSDDATEEQIFDHTSFKNFLGLRIGDDIPDGKTIRDFKQHLEKGGREGGRKLFEAFNTHLEDRGIIAREGSIINASFTEAPRQGNGRCASGLAFWREPKVRLVRWSLRWKTTM